MRRGDLVRVKQDGSYAQETFNRRGQTGKIVTTPERACVDWHKNQYETTCEVRFGPGDTVEIDVDDLEVIDDVVSRMAQLGKFLPTEKDIGRGVVYTPEHGGPSEDGAITSFNERFVFVRYQDQHPGAPGKATHHKDLRWLTE